MTTQSSSIPQTDSTLKLYSAIRRSILHVIVWVWTIIMGFPIFWMVATALKTEQQANAYPPQWLPNPIQWQNFYNSMTVANFGRYFFNTAVVSLATVIFVLFFSSLAGYTFARLRFPGRNLLFFIILSTMMVPSQVTMIPIFVMMSRFPGLGGNNLMGQGGAGLLNTFAALIIPQVAGAFYIFMMRQFMSTLPSELSDAARIDGASEFGIFWRIMLPLSGPALTTMGLFAFSNSWNSFLWPLVVTNTEAMRTVQLGLAVFRGIYFTQTTLFMAGTTIATLPVLLLFLFGQRYFVRGIALSGIKG